MKPELTTNKRAIDYEGLWKTALRLHVHNLDQSPRSIFIKLLRAKIMYLSNTEGIFLSC